MLNMKTCGQCKHFIGGGDWNLCCGIEHPTPKEKERGLKFLFGYLCYADTNACDMFESKEELVMQKKYIDAEELLQEDFTDFWHDKADQKVFENILVEAPAADVVEVRHGKWELHKDGSGTCNQCNIRQKNIWDYDNWQNYCGHCGAKMDGERKEQE